MDNVRGRIILLHTAQTRAECSTSGAVQGKARQGRAEIAGMLSCSTLLYSTSHSSTNESNSSSSPFICNYEQIELNCLNRELFRAYQYNTVQAQQSEENSDDDDDDDDSHLFRLSNCIGSLLQWGERLHKERTVRCCSEYFCSILSCSC